MMRGIEDNLKVLEEHGVTEIGSHRLTQGGDTPSAVARATRQILAGRITGVSSLGAPTQGRAPQMVLAGHGGLIGDGHKVNAVVVDAAEAKVAKLIAANAHERHLFVWIDEDEAELEMATLPPGSTPSLPDGIDVILAAKRGGSDVPFERLWCLQAGSAWETVGA